MNIQQLNTLYTERINRLAPYIRSIPDEDNRQEAMIGAYKALMNDTKGTDSFLINKAKWDLASAHRKGRSVDNARCRRSDIKLISYNQLSSDDGVFAEAVSANGAIPLDEQVINKICLDMLIDNLTSLEKRIVKYKVLEERSNKKIMELLNITNAKLKSIMSEIRFKIELAFI